MRGYGWIVESWRKGGIMAKLAMMMAAILIFAVVIFIALRQLQGGY